MSAARPGSIGRRLIPALDLLPPRTHDRISELGRRARLAVRTATTTGRRAAPATPEPPRPRRATERRGRVRRANILMYHRIARDRGDPYSLCVAPERFAEQLHVLSSRAEVVSLDEIRRPGRLPRVAVTFDDGYADNLLDALPVAERFGVPITVFVTSRMVGSPTGFWWDRLARALLGPRRMELSVRLPDGPISIVTGTDPAARAALEQLRLRLLPLPVEQIHTVATQICAEVAPEAETTGPRVLSNEELRTLAEHPLVTIGAHTTDHPLLRAQPPASQLEAIATSKADLESALGVEIRHFAYPFGHRASFDRRSMDAVRRSGFATACSTLRGCVTRWSDPLCLPRRMVMDWEAEVFGGELRSWGVP